MRFDTFDITAPAVFDEPWNEASVLGAATWLWMHSEAHRDAPCTACRACCCRRSSIANSCLVVRTAARFFIWPG